MLKVYPPNKWHLLLMLFMVCGICLGQNLVPNPSFEDSAACPDNLDQVNRATGWSSYRLTPDYFNSCSANSYSGVPLNNFDYQYPRTGNAYDGFFSFTLSGNYREYIGIQLSQQLIPGNTYYASMYVSRVSDITPQHKNIATNKLGFRFTTVPYSYSSPHPVDNFAHVYTDSIITDTLNWTHIGGYFTADSAYDFVCIGNFFNDTQTSYIRFDSLASAAYYFVDDICVATDSLTCLLSPEGVNEYGNPSFKIYPNPFNSTLNCETGHDGLSEITLSDVTLRILFRQTFTTSVSINTGQLDKGIYLYVVRSKNGVVKNGKLIKE